LNLILNEAAFLWDKFNVALIWMVLWGWKWANAVYLHERGKIWSIEGNEA